MKMKKLLGSVGCAIVIWLALYIGYLFFGSIWGFVTSGSDSAAVQKADTNHNGNLEVAEVIAAYKSIGLDGERLYNDFIQYDKRSAPTEIALNYNISSPSR